MTVQAFTISLRRRFSLKKLKQSDEATVLIEFAAGLPFLMCLGFGGAEFVNYTTTHMRLSQIALTVADNASRSQTGTAIAMPQMREVDITDIFKGAELQSGNLQLKKRGKIILSSLEVNSQTKQVIKWQRCFGENTTRSSFGAEGSTTTNGIGPTANKITANSGSAIMFVEVIYQYQPIVFDQWLSDQTKKLRYTAAFEIRDARDLSAGLTNPSPSVTVNRCA